MTGLVFQGSWYQWPSALRKFAAGRLPERAARIRESNPGNWSSGRSPPARVYSWSAPGQMLEQTSGVVFPAIAARSTSSVDWLTGIGCMRTRIPGCSAFQSRTSVVGKLDFLLIRSGPVGEFDRIRSAAPPPAHATPHPANRRSGISAMTALRVVGLLPCLPCGVDRRVHGVRERPPFLDRIQVDGPRVLAASTGTEARAALSTATGWHAEGPSACDASFRS